MRTDGTDVEVRLDFNKMPGHIGKQMSGKMLVFEDADEDRIINWIERKIGTSSQPVTVLAMGHLPNWLFASVGQYLADAGHDGLVEKYMYGNHGGPLRTVFDYTTPEVTA